MNKDPRKLYVLHDSRLNLYKIGSSVNPKRRVQDLSNAIGYHLDLEFVTPGHDFFLRHLDLPRVNHPVKHHGRSEWYLGNEETVNFILTIWAMPSLAAKTMTV